MQPLECPLAARIRVYREICCIFLLPQKEERHSRQGRGSDKHQIVTTCSFEKVRFRWEGQPARFNGSPWVSPPAGLWSIFQAWIQVCDGIFFFFLPLTSKIRSGLCKGISTEQLKSMHKALRINNNLVTKGTSVYPGLK